jgi:hypothetical protein
MKRKLTLKQEVLYVLTGSMLSRVRGGGGGDGDGSSDGCVDDGDGGYYSGNPICKSDYCSVYCKTPGCPGWPR